MDIQLDVHSMTSSIFGVFSTGSCSVPIDVYADEEKVGFLSSHWEFDPAGEFGEELDTYKFRTYVLDAAREKRSVLIGFDAEMEPYPKLHSDKDSAECTFGIVPMGFTIEMNGI